MSRPKPVFLPPAVVAHLLENKFVINDPANYRAVWFGEVLTFNESQRACWVPIFDNFLAGNLPLPHQVIIDAWNGDSAHLSYLFKLHPAWRRIIVGNGRGMYWLAVPERFLPSQETFAA